MTDRSRVRHLDRFRRGDPNATSRGRSPAVGTDFGATLTRRTAPLLLGALPASAYLAMTGSREDWYSEELGYVVVLVLFSVAVLVMVASLGRARHRLDAERDAIVWELQAINLELEHRLADRTSEVALERARAEALAATAPVGIFSIDRWGSYIAVNARWEELHDITAAAALDDAWLRCIHPMDVTEVMDAWRDAGTPAERLLEYRVIRGDGSVRLLRGRWAPVLQADGVITGYTGTVEDVTDTHLPRSRPADVALEDASSSPSSWTVGADTGAGWAL